MTTFLIGLCILLLGGILYGKLCVKVMKPDDRKTPAYTKSDGVDFVPMKTWKNSMINLLNIAGTGPILGPIQGILFGPIAFILIPIGCVLGGAMHDYFSGMLSLRNGGAQMPDLIKKYTGKSVYRVYMCFVTLLMILVAAVFVYTPGDIAATQVFGTSASVTEISTWVIYGVIFVYYIIATFFPIDKIIGRVYPIFGFLLLFSAVGIFINLFFSGHRIDNLSAQNWMGIHPTARLLPMFFITIACGIVSGFHSTQTAMISRSMTNERQGYGTFYNTMIFEGFIAMVWAAAAMGVMNSGLVDGASPPTIVGIIARDALGSVGGMLAIIGVIVLAVTSGDTALRALRLMIADYFKLDQKPVTNRLKLVVPLALVVMGLLVWAKVNPNGFNVLWRYFAWSNQTIALFAFAIITIYLMGRGYRFAPLMSLLPGSWYTFITITFIANAAIGFNLPLNVSYGIGVFLALVYSLAVYRQGQKLRDRKDVLLEAVPVY